ncbi:MAG: hypothetical protein ACYC55_05755 [Candidatus Geothermincolia bacterium]
MRRLIVSIVLTLVLGLTFIGFAWAAGSAEQADIQAQQQPQQPTPPPDPTVTWGDYKYTFTDIVPSDDLDPQSAIVNNYRGLAGHNTFSSANYVHLYMTIEWPTNERATQYMPLQLRLVSGGSAYRIFGRDYVVNSVAWRTVVRYPDYPGAPGVRIFCTFDTRGAAIDPATAYVEVVGLQEVWDDSLGSQLYSLGRTHFEWSRRGSTRYTSTPLVNFTVAEIE